MKDPAFHVVYLLMWIKGDIGYLSHQVVRSSLSGKYISGKMQGNRT